MKRLLPSIVFYFSILATVLGACRSQGISTDVANSSDETKLSNASSSASKEAKENLDLVQFDAQRLKATSCQRIAEPQKFNCSADCLPVTSDNPHTVSGLRDFCIERFEADKRHFAHRKEWQGYTNILITKEILYVCGAPGKEWHGIQYEVEAAPYSCPSVDAVTPFGKE